MHIWLNLIHWTIDIQEEEKIVKFYVQSQWGLFSCDITDSGIVPSREGDTQNFAQLVLLNGLSKFA